MNNYLYIMLAANAFNTFGTKVVGYVTKGQGIVYTIVAAAVLINGCMMIWGGESKEKAKKNMPWVIAGAVLALGAVTIATTEFKGTW